MLLPILVLLDATYSLRGSRHKETARMLCSSRVLSNDCIFGLKASSVLSRVKGDVLEAKENVAQYWELNAPGTLSEKWTLATAIEK